jgi:hypothetical protein
MNLNENSSAGSRPENNVSGMPEKERDYYRDPDDYGAFAPGQSIEADFQMDVLQLLKDREMEVDEYEVDQLNKHIDWAFAITAAIATAFILKNGDHKLVLAPADRLFLLALLFSGAAGLIAKFWPTAPPASQPLNSSTKDQLRKLRSLRAVDHPYTEIDVWKRISLFFDITLEFSKRNHTPVRVKPHKARQRFVVTANALNGNA